MGSAVGNKQFPPVSPFQMGPKITSNLQAEDSCIDASYGMSEQTDIERALEVESAHLFGSHSLAAGPLGFWSTEARHLSACQCFDT